MTPEQLNAFQVEQQIATDNYTRMNDRMNAIRSAAQSYLNATPEQQAEAKTAMQQLMNEYNTLNWQINEAFWRMNAANENYNNAIAQQQAIQQQTTTPRAGQRRRTIVVPNTETVVSETVVPEVTVPEQYQSTLPYSPYINPNTTNTNNNVKYATYDPRPKYWMQNNIFPSFLSTPSTKRISTNNVVTNTPQRKSTLQKVYDFGDQSTPFTRLFFWY